MENFSSPNEVGYLASKAKKNNFLYPFSVLFVVVIFYLFFLRAPANFPTGATFVVEKGASLQSVSALLKKDNLIRSKVAFEFFVILFGKEKGLVSANYLFEKKLPVFEIARRIGGGEHSTAPISVTIPEGFDNNQVADAFGFRLANFNKTEFLFKAEKLQGYLFPDTYFFLTNADEDIVLKSINNNFKKKIAPLRLEINTSGKSEKDIIIMASVIEKEAKGDDDREIISGILWKRIKIGMPLQADAAPETYKEKGLPKNPIANPGLESIKASIHPQSSPYLYYLHDEAGVIHYAKNFTEHKQNIEKYLK